MHGTNKVIDFTTVNEDDYDLTGQKNAQADEEEVDETKLRVQNLPQSQRAYAEKLVPFIGGERVPCMMYNNNWRMREKGVQEFSQNIQECFKNAS
jgi:hypothetical protein